MTGKYKAKDLMKVVEKKDWDKLADFASKSKSKKCEMTFKGLQEDLSDDELEALWSGVSGGVEEWMEALLTAASDKDKTLNKQIQQKMRLYLNAVLDLGVAFFEVNKPNTCTGLLSIVVYLNSKMLSLPHSLDSLRNAICVLCEKMFLHRDVYQGHVCSNTLLHILKRSLQPKAAKNEVKRLYALRHLILQVLNNEIVDSPKVVELLKLCAVSSHYVNMPEGQKIIRIALTHDNVCNVREVHESIKKRLYTCPLTQAASYGKIYYHAWVYALKHDKSELKEELELTCIQSFIMLAIEARIAKLLENLRKVLAQFHSQKKETYVAKMLYSLYQPILWRHIKSHDGVVRANAAQLFLDVFPLEDPDEMIVTTDQELNDQMLMIKDLLTDEFQQVRSRSVFGLCVAMMVHWELFPPDMVHTYFVTIINECSTDSSSHEVRCAVPKGFKVLLENPMTFPRMVRALHQIKFMLHDTHDSVRVAFVQLLQRVKRINNIKYFNIVKVEDLLWHLAEDKPLAKPITALMRNSYFPSGEGPQAWLPRCMDMVRMNPAASNVFFHHIAPMIGVEATAHFMKRTIESIHYYVRSKVAETPLVVLSSRSSSSKDVVVPEEALGLHDPYMVSGLANGMAIMWRATFPTLEKPENKQLLKMVVSKYTKCLGDLSLYYKDTPAWEAVYYLCSCMPSVPSLPPLCFMRLRALREDCGEEEFVTLLECLCSQEPHTLLELMQKWLEKGLTEGHVHLTPKPKKRKTKKSMTIHEPSDEPKPLLALKMLAHTLERRTTQKALLLTCPDQLKDLLKLLDLLQRKVEMSVDKNIKEKDFLRGLHYTLLKVAVLLQSEDQFNAVKFVEELLVWYQETLLQPQTTTTTVNSSRRSSAAKQSPKVSEDFLELSRGMSQDVCSIMDDLTLLQLLNNKSSKFVKFSMSLLPLGGSLLQPVCRLLWRYTLNGSAQFLLSEKETNTLKIVPDCFMKIVQHLREKEFYDGIPNSDMKEIQCLLSESLESLRSLSELDELLSSITLCIIKNILSDMDSSFVFEDLQKECDIFENLPTSAFSSTLLSMVCAKPLVAVYFLKQLQSHLTKPEMNIQTWVSFVAIVYKIRDFKKPKSVERELLLLLEKMGGALSAHPLKMVDTNIPQEEPKEACKEKQSFEEHCMFEYKKLKDVVVKKSTK